VETGSRQIKSPEPRFDSIEAEKALGTSSSVASSFETPRKNAAPQDEVLNPHGEERGNAAPKVSINASL
jgi:hypothetical protein